MKHLLLAVFVVAFCGCSSADDLKSVADAAVRASGGTADAATGSKRIDLSAQVSQTGDQTQEAWKLEVQRNTSSQAAGATYSLASLAGGGGGLKTDEIDADPIVQMIRGEIAAAEAPAVDADGVSLPRPVARIDALRSELAARLEVLVKAHRDSQAAPQVTGNVMIVLAPQGIGGAQPQTSEVDANLAGQVAGILQAAKGATSRPTDQ